MNGHLKREHDVVMHDYEYSNDDDNSTPPPMQRASVDLNDVRGLGDNPTPSYSKWNEHPYDVYKGAHGSRRSKPYQFKYPLSMMVAGPSRSWKTYYVARLLMTKDKLIHPTPDRIVYCYRHWKRCTTHYVCITLAGATQYGIGREV